jgi:putative SOS response-associated peptidase YedK
VAEIIKLKAANAHRWAVVHMRGDRIAAMPRRCGCARRTRADHDAMRNATTTEARWPPVTNIRNTSSPHWRGWLKPESRCLVPFNSFAEYAPEPNPATGKKDVV